MNSYMILPKHFIKRQARTNFMREKKRKEKREEREERGERRRGDWRGEGKKFPYQSFPGT